MRHGLVSGSPMQKVVLSFTEGNLWQLRDRKEDEPIGGIRVHWKSGLQYWAGIEASESELTAGHVVHRDRERLVLGSSRTGLVMPGSAMKDTIAWRQRGHGIAPGGPGTVIEVLLVEHR